MRKKSLILIIAVLLLGKVAWAQKLEAPKLDPTPSTERQKQLIAEGTSFHDRGDYDAAISRYQQVIDENPANVHALYEMAFSYYLKQDYEKSLAAAYKAAKYKSDLLGRIYGQIGNCQDDLGKPQEAIATYKAGLKLLPTFSLLHYNLALTYARTGKFDEALPEVKKSASLNPAHASSQSLLSVIFDKGGYKTPALLAACRFLILEPKSKRSDAALGLVQRVMRAGVSRKDENTISIFMDSSPKKDEGDFGSVDLMMGLLQAGNMTKEKKDQSEMELLVANFSSLFAILSEQQDKADHSKFTWKFYVPYFAELKARGHTEAFAFYINQRGTATGVDQWLQQHPDKVNDFLSWSKAYQWPKADSVK